MVPVVCACIVRRGDQLLLVHEAKPAALGRWSLPGGKVETGEGLRDAAGREVAEETGLDVEVGDLVGVYHCPETLEGGAAVTFVFAAVVVGGEIRLSDAHPRVEWVDRGRFADLVGANLIRGRHVPLAIDALDRGHVVGDGFVVEIEASDPPG